MHKGNKFFIFLWGFTYDALSAVLWVLSLPVLVVNRKLRSYTIQRTRYTRIIAQVKAVGESPVFIYCSSIGELEQAMPLIGRIDEKGIPYFLFFHSKHGWEHAHHIGLRHFVLTPFDFFAGWFWIFKRCKPSVCIVDRHECWPGFVLNAALQSRLFLINAVAKPYYNRIYSRYIAWLHDHCEKVFFVNAPAISKARFVVTGDTRNDRLLQRVYDEAVIIDELRATTKDTSRKTLIIGNAYVEDARVLFEMLSLEADIPEEWQVMVVPARPSMVTSIMDELGSFQEMIEVDASMGKLFAYYQWADAAWIGGGFSPAGIHNTLEASLSGGLLLSGPNLNHQPDAVNAFERGVLHVCKDAADCILALKQGQNFQSNPGESDKHSPVDMIFDTLFPESARNSMRSYSSKFL